MKRSDVDSVLRADPQRRSDDERLDIEAAELFRSAIDLDGDARRRFLDRTCAQDSQLRQKLDALLEADQRGGEFLCHAALCSHLDFSEDATSAFIGRQVGNYRIERLVGVGGMGAVYEATQESPRRSVAVKMMRSGIITSSTLRRFEYEAQILARLRHPGVVQIFEAGVYEFESDVGIPYFAMEYIPGASAILSFAREKALSTRERLELFAQVCEAVDHGHQVGIIHRDLKPGNILVDGEGRPKVIDFGVARAVGSDQMITTVQGVGGIVGTLRYMSPEQCSGDPAAIDARSDVYGLGVVLFELLSGKMPYEIGESLAALALTLIREAPPLRLSAVDKRFHGDVEIIVAKCLAKERERRYQSAGALARDIRHFLAGEPIEARRESAVYVLRMLVKRHRIAVFAAVTVIGLLVASSVVAWWLVVEEKRAEARAVSGEAMARRRAESEKRISEFYAGLFEPMDPWTPDGLHAIGKPTDVRASDILREAVKRIPPSFKDRPDLAANLQRRIGSAFVGLCLESDAEALYRSAYDSARQSLGEDDPATLELRVGLGNAIAARGEVFEATRTIEPAATGMVRVLGEDNPTTLGAFNALSNLLCLVNRLDDAARVSNQAMRIAERLYREDDPRYVNTLSIHAALLGYFHQPEESERLRRRAVQLARGIAGGHSIYLGAALQRLRTAIFYSGKYEEGLALVDESLAIWRSIEGENFLSYIQDVRGRCVLLTSAGRCDEALSAARELVASISAHFGAKDSNLITARIGLVLALTRCGQPGEGEQVARQAIAEADKPLPPYARQELGLALAGALEAEGRTAAAESCVIDTLQSLHPSWINNGNVRWNWRLFPLVGRCMARLGAFDEAEWRLLDAHRRFSVGRDANIERDQTVVADLIALYQAWGKPQEAARFRGIARP